MAEYDKNIRKKKIFTAPRQDKEFSPRKPVILTKNDREYKDFDRNKTPRDKPAPVEKEKQPVIMIKTREPSTAKDENRPQSPKEKKSETETPVMQSVKIAQNEHKEKKSSESKILSPPIQMSHPIKLIDDFLDFSPAVAEHLMDTNTNFLVVGVIGNQSVGKSTILNILAHSSDLSNICSEILKSHESSSSPGEEDSASQILLDKVLPPVDSNDKIITNSIFTEELKKKPLIFKSQSMQQIETGDYCTSGVDVYVTNSRIILLDTGPVFSMGNRMMGGIGYNPISRGGLEIPAFLLAVCHIVVLVQDWFTDLNMLRFIQSAEMVKPSIPAASNISQSSLHTSSNSSGSSNPDNDGNSPKDHYPHLLFLQNKCSMDDFKPESVKLMQDLFKKAFSKSNMNIHSGMYMYDPESNNDSNQTNGMFHNLNAERCGKPVNLFLMPTIAEDHDNKFIFRGHPSVEELAHRLRWQIFGASRNQLTNVQLNERTWLQYCNKTWDNIKKSAFFMEYNKLCEYNNNK